MTQQVCSYDQGTQSDLILLDFAKAFDTVSHQCLLYKLSWYGIHDQMQTLQWIESFLTGHYQKVVVENTCSNKVPVPVISGVPQGTVLGPILFSIFINDLPDTVKHSNVHLFADDCILYKQINSINGAQNLQSDLDSLYVWAKTWLMKFSVSVMLCISHKPNYIKSTLLSHSLGEGPLVVVDTWVLQFNLT